jgi:hypothetical protein
VQGIQGDLMAWSTRSIASRGGGEERLEAMEASVSFGRALKSSFLSELRPEEDIRGCTGSKEEDGEEKMRRGSLVAPESASIAGRCAEL